MKESLAENFCEEPAKTGWTCGKNREGERLTKRMDALRVDDRMRRGRSRLGWGTG